MEKKTGIKRAKKFNQCHRAKKLPELDPGDTIYIRDLKREAVVVEQHHSPRSYLVRTSQQTTPLRWNRRHLVATPREQPPTTERDETPTIPRYTPSPNRPDYHTSRCGRTIRPPDRLDL
ncbi:hypothetical protein RRG08_028650 [Elysia crispata]|uniref:Uncharacterized protein n=1 Tax=Elysia crispata TaxID=231223 RepID=A0AAE1DDK4_9GAST|nr:hypothetical protein RRG08_028650 [Elysia crispata]